MSFRDKLAFVATADFVSNECGMPVRNGPLFVHSNAMPKQKNQVSTFVLLWENIAVIVIVLDMMN